MREPFRYFEEARDRLPYPVVSLLPAFEAARSETLFLHDDPHWNRRGAELAGSTVARAIEVGGLIPCSR